MTSQIVLAADLIQQTALPCGFVVPGRPKAKAPAGKLRVGSRLADFKEAAWISSFENRTGCQDHPRSRPGSREASPQRLLGIGAKGELSCLGEGLRGDRRTTFERYAFGGGREREKETIFQPRVSKDEQGCVWFRQQK